MIMVLKFWKKSNNHYKIASSLLIFNENHKFFKVFQINGIDGFLILIFFNLQLFDSKILK
jgi:hypothetical protein